MKLSYGLFVLSLTLPASPSEAFPSATRYRSSIRHEHKSALFMEVNNNKDNTKRTSSFFRSISPSKLLKPMSLGLLLSISTSVLHNQPAEASAPVMAVPIQEMPNPETMALNKVRDQINARERAEMEAYNRKARLVEQEHGEAARDEFEREYQAAKQAAADAKTEGLRVLRMELLSQGICPWVDPEGYRQVFLYKNGMDLATVPGTKYYGNQQFELRKDKRAFSVEKKANRDMIKLIVEDCRNKGLDVVEYFEQHQDRTAQILSYPRIIALQKLQAFQTNVELYGETEVPKVGTLSVLEQQAADPGRVERLEQEAARKVKDAEDKTKADARDKVNEEKASAKAAKELIKAKAKAAKEQLKAEKSAELQKSKDATKAATAAAAAGALAAAKAAGDVAAASVDPTMQAGFDAMSSPVSSEAVLEGVDIESEIFEADFVAPEVAAPTHKATKEAVDKKKLPIVPTTTFLMAVGGGAFVLSKSRQQAAADEEERQRQFKLIMGISEKEDKDKKKKFKKAAPPSFDLDDLDDDTPKPSSNAISPSLDDSDDIVNPFKRPSPSQPVAPATKPIVPAVPESIPDIPKKKKGGIRSMFTKKTGNTRESDLSVLVSPGAQAPELATLLAKLLSFGAPGRFPQVDRLPGAMPVEEFDLDEAKSLLVEECEAAGLSKEGGAEIFANVVNCMLIDIVDLASAALKEDAMVTFDAMNVVIDFMNHAASLYDAVAEDVIITPVTYGGTLAKPKLEQMYGSYAFSAMLKMEDGSMEDRIDLLRNVFDINEKKAEGIVMKATQKNMMEMMKNPERMEDLEKLMGGMLGQEGMAGLEGLMGGGGENGGEPNLEQLKEMLTQLKIMKDAGTIPPEELQTVRQQFKESFGSSIDEIVSQATNDKDAMTDGDRELLDLMKDILEV